jgi:VWFA-related protein
MMLIALAGPWWSQATFRGGVDVVTVDALVRDRGRVITGLTAGDFELLDNGVPQQVMDVSFGKLPIDLTVALDLSLSVTGSLLDRLRTAIVQLMGDLGKADRLRLLFFNSRVSRAVDFTTDVAAVERAIRDARAGGSTTLFDAMSVALTSASPPDRRQLVMFFTDGTDSSSATTPEALTIVAQRSRATLSVVIAMPTAAGTFASAAPARATPLDPIARETGGAIVWSIGDADLSRTFRRLLEEFRTTYVLHFTPRGVERAGYHTLQVKVKRSGAMVNARRGYVGG